MKKIVSIITLLMIMTLLHAGLFKEQNGNAVLDKEQVGTYSSLTKTDGILKWSCNIDRNGTIMFIFKEGGQNVRLSTAPGTNAIYDVNINFNQSFICRKTGTITSYDDVYNSIIVSLGSESKMLIENDTMEITISGYGSVYKLGPIDISELASLFIKRIEGSASGLVFYDKGFYSDGWRYLEAAPADLRVIDGVPSVDKTAVGYDKAFETYIFGYFRKSPDGDNLFVSGSDYDMSICTGTSVGDGKRNTDLLVNAIGDMAYSKTKGDERTWYYAPKLCADLSYENDGVVYDDWFLPSKDELKLIYDNLYCKGLGSFFDTTYWSSSEYYKLPSNAWIMFFRDGSQINRLRFYNHSVRPIRAF